jgi:hypothetical protein
VISTYRTDIAKEMISLKKIKSDLSSRKVNYDSPEFFDIHRSIEAYIKRILLISLRIKGIKYKESTVIVERTYISTADLIEKVLFLLDQSSSKQAEVVGELKKRYKDFFVLKELLLKFSSKFRNLLAHGTIGELKDPELIRYLCHVNKSFYQEFENLLKKEYGHSAFDKPGDWGAKRGVDEEIEKSAKRLRLGKILNQPLSLETVKNKLADTKYAKP